ncbi:MAG: hypothetical protein ACJAZ9_000619, partial [Neolewinella sp.]
MSGLSALSALVTKTSEASCLTPGTHPIRPLNPNRGATSSAGRLTGPSLRILEVSGLSALSALVTKTSEASC